MNNESSQLKRLTRVVLYFLVSIVAISAAVLAIITIGSSHVSDAGDVQEQLLQCQKREWHLVLLVLVMLLALLVLTVLLIRLQRRQHSQLSTFDFISFISSDHFDIRDYGHCTLDHVGSASRRGIHLLFNVLRNMYLLAQHVASNIDPSRSTEEVWVEMLRHAGPVGADFANNLPSLIEFLQKVAYQRGGRNILEGGVSQNIHFIFYALQNFSREAARVAADTNRATEVVMAEMLRHSGPVGAEFVQNLPAFLHSFQIVTYQMGGSNALGTVPSQNIQFIFRALKNFSLLTRRVAADRNQRVEEVWVEVLRNAGPVGAEFANNLQPLIQLLQSVSNQLQGHFDRPVPEGMFV